MIASNSFVFRGNVNSKPRISLIAHAKGKFILCLLNFPHAYDMQPRNLVEDKRFLLSTNFPSFSFTNLPSAAGKFNR